MAARPPSVTLTPVVVATAEITTAAAAAPPANLRDVPSANDERRHSGSLTLFSNFWSNNSSAVSLHRRESVDSGAVSRLSTDLSQLSPASFLPRSRHRPTKSTSSRVSLSSQPVLVRSYTPSGGERSRTPSIAPAPRAGSKMRSSAPLPPVEAFSFSGILRAVEPDIQGAIDGIAEIYAHSRLSLANEHGAHMPPLGEIVNPRVRQSGLVIRTTGLERTLTTVAEASSSSERLAGESRAASTSSGKGKATAYGSLRNIISRGKSPEASLAKEGLATDRSLPAGWTINEDGRPSILLTSQSFASHQLNPDAAAELHSLLAVGATEIQENPAPMSAQHVNPSPWLPWRKSWKIISSAQASEPANAEHSLKRALLLRTSTAPNSK